MKAKLISLPCCHMSNRSIDGKDNGERYWVIELTETSVGDPVYLKIPIEQYPIDSNGYDDHGAAKTLLETLLQGMPGYGYTA